MATQWQSLAFKKSADVVNIKRQSAVLRPYNSAGEINFHRGVGITLGKKGWQATVFGSYKNIDANFIADTSQSQDDFVSSLQTSGFHRTKSEVEDKGVQRQLAFGGNFSYQYKNLHIGINAIQYKFMLPIQKGNEPYNKFALAGSSFGNYSIDYSYTYKNLHFFGEAASTQKMDKAFVQGVLLSAANNVDISLFYRNIQRSYQSLYTNAFTEGTYPTNEKGLYTGISIKPAIAWRIDAYADFYSFPWLRFRVDAPSSGSDYLVQLNYKPNKQLEIYTRFRAESKRINVNPTDFTLNPVIPQPRQSWRTHSVYKISPAFSLKNRVEVVWFDKKGDNKEQGFLTYVDVAFKPALKPLSASLRLQYFETDGYNSRLYAYENDVLYSFSIPVFYEKGFRYYLNANYDLNKKMTVWFRVAQTLNPDRTTIGSGLDEISATGFAWGYIGSLIPFFIGIIPYGLTLFGFLPEEFARYAISIAFVISLAWWYIYSQPLLKDVEQQYSIDQVENSLGLSLRRLGKTFKEIRSYKYIFIFLIAYLLYIDVVNSVIRLATNIGSDLFIPATTMLGVIILVQVIACLLYTSDAADE